MDYDFSYIMGQPMVPIIPALLPLAETTGASPAELMAAYIVGFEVVPSARYRVRQFAILAHLLATDYRPVLKTEESVVYQRLTGGTGTSRRVT
jgi:hypothetical protein